MLNRKKNGFSKEWTWGGLAIVALSLFAILGDQGLLKFHKMKQTEKQMQTLLADLKFDNDQLAHEIERIKQPTYLEKIVRDELGFLRKDEVIFYVTPALKH